MEGHFKLLVQSLLKADILGYGWRSAYVMAGAPGLIIAALLIFIKV